MTRQSNYDKFLRFKQEPRRIAPKMAEIGSGLLSRLPGHGGVICVECYPGTLQARSSRPVQRADARRDHPHFGVAQESRRNSHNAISLSRQRPCIWTNERHCD